MPIFILLITALMTRSAAPALAVESFIDPAFEEKESSDSIGPSLERRDALDYDPTRHSLLPDYYNSYRTWREELNKQLRLEALFFYDMLTQGYADRDWSLGASSGDVTVRSRWLMFGHRYNRPGYISFRIRHWPAYDYIAPSELGSLQACSGKQGMVSLMPGSRHLICTSARNFQMGD